MTERKIMNNGTLYIVATPIGNLDDITLRAIETLKNVDVIACEDTRVSRKLLDHFDIKKPLVSLHQHSGEEVVSRLVGLLVRGENIAYITDGGTPGISDPGQKLAQRVQLVCHPREDGDPLIVDSRLRGNDREKNGNDREKNGNDREKNGNDREKNGNDRKYIDDIRVVPVPGPSAAVTAISVSGMVEKEFYFAGFLPKKKGRQTKMIELSKIDVPIVIYESALRLERTLTDIEQYFGKDAEVFIAREMTKMFEEYWGGKISEVLLNIGSHKLKGEMVLIVKRFQSK